MSFKSAYLGGQSRLFQALFPNDGRAAVLVSVDFREHSRFTGEKNTLQFTICELLYSSIMSLPVDTLSTETKRKIPGSLSGQLNLSFYN